MPAQTFNTNEIEDLPYINAYGIKFRNNIAGASAPTYMDHYEEYTHGTTGTITGMGSAINSTIRLLRSGKNVTMVCGGDTAKVGVAALMTFATNLPTRFCPVSTICCSVPICNNNASVNGIMKITTGGVVTIGVVGTASTNDPAAMTVTANAGITSGIVASWIVA